MQDAFFIYSTIAATNSNIELVNSNVRILDSVLLLTNTVIKLSNSTLLLDKVTFKGDQYLVAMTAGMAGLPPVTKPPHASVNGLPFTIKGTGVITLKPTKV